MQVIEVEVIEAEVDVCAAESTIDNALGSA
jgi:hypothetical protein